MINKSVQLLTYVGGNAIEVIEEGYVDNSQLAVYIAGLSKLLLDSRRFMPLNLWWSITGIEHSYESNKHSQRW